MYCRISKYTRGKKTPFQPQKYFWNKKSLRDSDQI